MSPREAIRYFKESTRLNPKSPPWILENFAESYVMMADYKSAVPIYEKALAAGARGFIKAECHLGLAIAYDGLGRGDEARSEIAKAVETVPKFTIKFLRAWNIYRDKDYAEHWLATLKRLGLPEE